MTPVPENTGYLSSEDQILEDSIFRIGKVISVEGRQIKVKVDRAKNTSHLLYKGILLRNIVVGGYIKIAKGFIRIVGKVEGEYITEEKSFEKKQYKRPEDKINRVLNISLLGFLSGNRFERGIKELPLIDNECFLLRDDEFNQVHDFLTKDDEPIVIGTLALEKGQQIKIGVNSLLASHIGIFGNTGSGKSYTVAKIYHELMKHYKSRNAFKRKAAFFLLDFNGEYVSEDDNVIVEKEFKNIYKLSTFTQSGADKFPIPRDALYDHSFWAVLTEATEKTQTPFLRRALRFELFSQGTIEDRNDAIRAFIVSMITQIFSKKDVSLGLKVLVELFADLRSVTGNKDGIDQIRDFIENNVGFYSKTGVYYAMGQQSAFTEQTIKTYILDPLSERINALEFEHEEVDEIRLRIVLKYYDEIVKGHAQRDHLSPLIKRLDNRLFDLKKVITIEPEPEIEKNFTIVSLRDVNFDMKKVLPLLLCKRLYDEKKKKGDVTTYLNIIIDEAHNILSWNSERESEQWKDYRLETFEEIIKEGRKFGVFLTIASQRPADISATIISQLHNYFLHRLINNKDIEAVEKTISFLDKVSFEYLPILPTGTCILAGLLAQVPVVVAIDRIDKGFEPFNATMTLVEKWRDEASPPSG